MAIRIPFNRPTLRGRELDHVAQALASGHWAGDGRFTRACERILEEESGSARALLTTSCTDALEMAALFGRYQTRPLGSFGELSTLSFHETKNITCGEGGALLVNHQPWAGRAEILREKGTDRRRFSPGQIDKYGWVDLGSSFLPSDLLAAVLVGQLEERAAIQARREALWRRYAGELSSWAELHGAEIPYVPAHCDQAYHMFYLIMPSLGVRGRLIAHLAQTGILAVSHYLPLNRSDMARGLGSYSSCPVTEDISDRIVRLPFFPALTDDEQGQVIEAIRGTPMGALQEPG